MLYKENLVAYLSFKDNEEVSYIVSFRNCVDFWLSKNHDLDFLLFNINDVLSIDYKTNVARENYTDVNGIIVTSNTPSTVPGTFQFNAFVPYEKDVTIENVGKSSQKSDTLIDLGKVNTETNNHDPRIF